MIWSRCGDGMQLSLKMGITSVATHGNATFDVLKALGKRNGFAIDFRRNRMVVNDVDTPANDFDGDPQSKLTIYGSDSWLVDPQKGLSLDALRDFSIAMATNAFPYNTSAMHVYARYSLNAADSGDQRYLFMLDNAGNDRFAMYTTSGTGFRLVSGDGTSADIEVSALPLEADTEYQTFVGIDANGRSWVDDGGIQTNDALLLATNAGNTHIGLGGYPDRVLRVLDGYLAEVLVICDDIIQERRLTQEPLLPYYAAEGDSHTFNVSFGMAEATFYPQLIADVDGLSVRNFGASGQSSAHMLVNVDAMFVEDLPSIATIYAGSNDTVTSVVVSPVPTSIRFAVDSVAKLAVGGWVLVNGESRKIGALVGNVVTLETALGAAPVEGDELAVDTETNLRHWVQFVKAAGVDRVAIIGSHYLNFASSGDTPELEQSLRAGVRLAQQAAALAENVPYVDTYAYMRNLVVSGTVVQGDWAVWHQGATNTHLTEAGEQVLADAIHAALF